MFTIEVKRAGAKRFTAMDSGMSFASALESFARVIQSETRINNNPGVVRMSDQAHHVIAKATFYKGEWI